jgi:hypothetical protein
MLGPEGIHKGNAIHWLYHKKTDSFHFPVKGFNECLITYIMALRDPDPIPERNFQNWYANYGYKYFYGQKVIFFPTLFTQHYSFMWIDPRSLRDHWTAYFDNAKIATHINREYSVYVQNSKIWGLTACDGPEGYKAYGVDLPFIQSFYDGTISPSASAGSIPYVPVPVIANLRRIYSEHKELAYGRYGFYDSFNVERNWSSDSFLGITEGVIYLQIENYLDQTVWKTFMKDKGIKKALKRAGFKF